MMRKFLHPAEKTGIYTELKKTVQHSDQYTHHLHVFLVATFSGYLKVLT